jgi:hypothetical protein
VGRQSATDQEHLEITEKDVGVAMQTFIDETDQSFYDDYLKATEAINRVTFLSKCCWHVRLLQRTKTDFSRHQTS